MKPLLIYTQKYKSIAPGFDRKDDRKNSGAIELKYLSRTRDFLQAIVFA
jgi:hypothetical protein